MVNRETHCCFNSYLSVYWGKKGINLDSEVKRHILLILVALGYGENKWFGSASKTLSDHKSFFKEEIHLVLHCISVFIMVAYKK